MANQNSNSFLAKFTKLPMATKIISLVCVVVIIAGSATAAVLLTTPDDSKAIGGTGHEKPGITTSKETNTTVSTDSDADDDVIASTPSSETSSAEEPVSSNSSETSKAPTGATSSATSVPSSTPSSQVSSKVTSVASTPSNPTVTSTPTQPTSEFYNPNNYSDMLYSNGVNIKPRYVYWKDGKLYAECFVINGMSGSVWNINVKNIRFYNKEGNIASASFGLINPNQNFNGSVPPHSYIVWTFVFSDDAIVNYGADLSVLGCSADTEYSH